MAYDPGTLDAALAAAVGEDDLLIAELKTAFFQSTEKHAAHLAGARNDAQWDMALWRIKGLAASFGAIRLVEAVDEVRDYAPGDPVALRIILAAIERFRPSVVLRG